MNEHSRALLICRHLDRGTEKLSYRVLERLAAARAAAVSTVAAPAPSSVSSAHPESFLHERPAPARDAEERVPLWWRLSATAVPVLLLVLGVFMVDTVHQEQSAAELAEVDSALLTDDVPLVAYADAGFGVYINNMRR